MIVAANGCATSPALFPNAASVPLVAVLWQGPEECCRQASVEAVVYEDGTVVLDVSTSRPEWGRLSGADLARLRDDVRELADKWSKDSRPFGEARLGADSHLVFVRVRGEFRHSVASQSWMGSSGSDFAS